VLHRLLTTQSIGNDRPHEVAHCLTEVELPQQEIGGELAGSTNLFLFGIRGYRLYWIWGCMITIRMSYAPIVIAQRNAMISSCF
jgi:hypothetical protein